MSMLIFILLGFMASRHAGLLCKVGKCKCPDVDEALDVCRTETLRYNVGVSMYLACDFAKPDSREYLHAILWKFIIVL
jgi:hypothetical protein